MFEWYSISQYINREIWKYVECLNGISIGISQYTHRENMEIC